MTSSYSLKWTANAEADVLDIINYIKKHSGHMRAASIYERIRARAEPLVDFPGSGRAVPQLASIGIDGVRQISEKPWNIYYKIIDNDIWILSKIILHGAKKRGGTGFSGMIAVYKSILFGIRLV
jgi:plasmid stabilization system protein ParE